MPASDLSRPIAPRPIAAQRALARFALRDLRGSLRFYGVFIAALVLGVMAIVGVDATARAFRDGLAQQGAVLLGGDLAFSRAFGAPSEQQRAFLDQHGKVSQIVFLRAMARRQHGSDDALASALVEVKAVEFGLSPDRRRQDRTAFAARTKLFRRARGKRRRLRTFRRPDARRAAEREDRRCDRDRRGPFHPAGLAGERAGFGRTASASVRG